MDAKKLENPTEEMSRQITEGRANRPAHSEEVDPTRNQINADSDTLLPCRAVSSKVSSEPMLAESGQQVSEPVQTRGLHGQGPGGSDLGRLILGAVRSGWPGACHEGKSEGAEDAPEWVWGMQPHGPCREGHAEATATPKRPFSVTVLRAGAHCARHSPGNAGRLLQPLATVFSLIGRHGTLLHVGLCLKTAS